MSGNYLDQLKNATVSHNGTSITILFRTRDIITSQFKAGISFRSSVPVQFIFQTSEKTQIEWWVNGVCFNPHGAAIVVDSATMHVEEYHNSRGAEARSDGPSSIRHTYRKHYEERWQGLDFVVHRDGGPARTSITYGTPPEMVWQNWGWLNNTELVSDKHKTYFGDSETVTNIAKREFSWYQKGKRPSKSWAWQMDNGIAEGIRVSSALSLSRTTVISHRQLEWYDEDEKLHRTDGPAMVRLEKVKEVEKDKKQAPWKYETWTAGWYIHGKHIPEFDIINWARKNQIKMWTGIPCYDRSAFRDTAGEFCFLTDMVGVMK
jgi:hypothetical protein